MRIAILLSTYNGEKYLNAQLDSLIIQTNKSWKLYIRDDGSFDKTIQIIDGYISKYPELIIRIDDNLGNLKSAASFMYLLSIIEADYYMFCDQDDIWLPEKIEISLNKIITVENISPNIPVLVFTDLTLVDDEINMINNSMWNYSNIDPNNARDFYKTTCLSSITGCTMIFNNYVKQVVLPYPKVGRMHDWWIALNTIHFGKVDYINSSTILYRQHDNNVLGAMELSKGHYLKRFIFFGETIKDNIKVLKMLSALKFKVSYSKFFFTKIKVLIKKIAI